ncbi:hypothetical protein EPI10_019941 [Gossypium australe]|uniref:Uncharacterized protein n=1 Tax=Gossypium australe TaxID=47621 RepID=A0A5B6WCF8_9ROSI|nr:hypothetical protein EPI10_019941 [Gossypium australe]
MENAKGGSMPMLSKHMGGSLENLHEYQSIVGALEYVVPTHPDITYAVNRICRFIHASTDVHHVAAKRIFCYLYDTIDYGIQIQPFDKLSLVVYADANWGLDFYDRRSTTGYCVFFGGNPVCWCSKKQ